MKLLVSACLLGARCRYDGRGNENQDVLGLLKEHQLVPVCPEIMGGLRTPRPPAELRGERVVTKSGEDVTDAFERGAGEAARLAALFGCQAAILKEKSPSCGCGVIYDGSFSKRLTRGDGVTARLLREKGVPVYGESRVREIKSNGFLKHS